MTDSILLPSTTTAASISLTKHVNPEVIKLNIGGHSYFCKISTLRSRAMDSKLARFVQCSHEAKLCLCDAYFEETNEYYFERPPKLFDSIYKYYTTGALHRPLDVCEVEFYTELTFWRISEDQISPCCWPRHNHLPVVENVVETTVTRFGVEGGGGTPNNGNLPNNKSDSLEDLSLSSKKRSNENETLRDKICRFAEGDGSTASLFFTSLSIGFVLISVLGLVLGSIHEFQVPIHKKVNITKRVVLNDDNNTLDSNTTTDIIIWEPHPLFDYLETICIIWFTVEYLLRFIVAPKRCSFIFELLNVVDLIAILPFFLELALAIFGFNAATLNDIKGAFFVFRILRVLRVVRILKLGRYSSGMRTFALTLRSSARQLGMMGMVLCTGVIFFSTLIYYVEKDEQNTPFTSIPAAFWFVLVTMTTVGYGDSVPITTAGKLIASGAIVSGVLVLALPITIIVDNFMKVSGNHQQTMFGAAPPPPPQPSSSSNNNNNNNNHPLRQHQNQQQQFHPITNFSSSILSSQQQNPNNNNSPTNSLNKKSFDDNNLHFAT